MLVLFFVLWIAFNGRWTAEIAVFGIVISLLVFLFVCRFMDYSIKKELHAYANVFHGFFYLVLLVKEIVKANIAVMRLIVSSKYEIEPKIVKFKTDLKSDTLRVVLANSITLTPGTITVMLEENEYLVHCLDKDFAEGMEDSEFVKRLRKMEQRGEKKA